MFKLPPEGILKPIPGTWYPQLWQNFNPSISSEPQPWQNLFGFGGGAVPACFPHFPQNMIPSPSRKPQCKQVPSNTGGGAADAC